MPFKSKAQMKAAFSGGLGSKMKKRAKLWAEHTPDIEGLPEHADTEKSLNLWKGKIISLDMAYEKKLLKAYSGDKKGLAHWQKDYEKAKAYGNMKLANEIKANIEKQKKLQWQKKTKTGKLIIAHRRKA